MSTERKLCPGDIVSHFKRETLTEEEKARNMYLYCILAVGTDSETGGKVMIYRALYGDFGVYVRPYEMFMSETDHEKYPDIQQKYRFEKI